MEQQRTGNAGGKNTQAQTGSAPGRVLLLVLGGVVGLTAAAWVMGTVVLGGRGSWPPGLIVITASVAFGVIVGVLTRLAVPVLLLTVAAVGLVASVGMVTGPGGPLGPVAGFTGTWMALGMLLTVSIFRLLRRSERSSRGAAVE